MADYTVTLGEQIDAHYIAENGGSQKTETIEAITDAPYVPLDSAVTQYRFEDDGDTTTALDSIGSNDGNINGGTYDSNSRCGSFAYRSDGTDDEVFSTNTVDLSASGDSVGVSVAGFFNPDSISSYSRALIWGKDNGNYLLIAVGSNGEWEAQMQVDNNNFTRAVGNSIDNSNYTHVAACWDGSDLYLIEDGTEVSRTTSTPDLSTVGAGNLSVSDGGSLFDSSSFDGLADDATFINKGLTESETEKLIEICNL